MKALFGGDDITAAGLPVLPGPSARQFYGCFVGLGTAVAKECTVSTGDLHQLLGQTALLRYVVQVGCVHKCLSLLTYGGGDTRVTVAGAQNRYACDEIQILLAICIPQETATAPYEGYGQLRVGMHQELVGQFGSFLVTHQRNLLRR